MKLPQFEIFFNAKCLNLETAEYEHNYSSYCLEYNDFSESVTECVGDFLSMSSENLIPYYTGYSYYV